MFARKRIGGLIVRTRGFRLLELMLVSLVVVGCATGPRPTGPDPAHLDDARRFLHSWNAGEVAFAGMRRGYQDMAKDQPALAEVFRRAFADVTPGQIEAVMAPVYARHVKPDHMAEVARFSESPTGHRFLRLAVGGAMEGKPVTGADMTRQFTADELIEILKFSQSESFIALQAALPTINQELKEVGRRFGEATLRQYLERQ